ncbi:hypothetical protein MKY14_10950 [Paenibacillus sp. FSL R5-0887]|jgi:aminoglycoside phosphotransferase (APT) family kinase protein|uniref:hypothetical protein n=1 Tax=Paenibacillus TaxID=44249 RepID=UPI00158B121E|nr:hypothetical protein [Paenibacillus odorifer]
MIPFFSDIPNASTWEVVEPVHKGWSKDRFDYGDPWEEFNRIPWCALTSPEFASG